MTDSLVPKKRVTQGGAMDGGDIIMSGGTAPIDRMLDAVEWAKVEHDPIPDELHATHEGVLAIMGHQFKVYVLSDGQRVFDADSVAAALGGEML